MYKKIRSLLMYLIPLEQNIYSKYLLVSYVTRKLTYISCSCLILLGIEPKLYTKKVFQKIYALRKKYVNNPKNIKVPYIAFLMEHVL